MDNTNQDNQAYQDNQMAKYIIIALSIFVVLHAMYPFNNKMTNVLISCLITITIYMFEYILYMNGKTSSTSDTITTTIIDANTNTNTKNDQQVAMDYVNKLIFG